MAHGFDDGGAGEATKAAGGGGDAGMAELVGDDGDVYAFGAELGGVGVAEAVGMDALVDTRPGVSEPCEHDAEVIAGWVSSGFRRGGAMISIATVMERLLPAGVQTSKRRRFETSKRSGE